MATITQTCRFFRPDMYSRLHRNVGTDVAEALQQWAVAGNGRSYVAQGRAGEAVLYQVGMDAGEAAEAMRALEASCDVQFMACAPVAE